MRFRFISSFTSKARPTAVAAGLILAATLAVATPADAAGGAAWVGKENTQVKTGADYWTPERMRSARPLPLPKVSAEAIAANGTEADAVQPQGAPQGANGARPSIQMGNELARKLFDVDPDELAAAKAELDAYDALEGDDVGTSGGQFSSTRVFPDAATTTYPYLAVGKLFFTIPGQGNFICSGSVINKRVVLTAGHCVHNGNGSQGGYYTNFMFVPAYRNGTAPFGMWNWAFVLTTPTWFSGGAVFPNAADYAMIETRDRNGHKIGDVCGFLGFQTLKLFPNHAHLLGYPANLDSGERMHEVTAQSFQRSAPNNVEYGSDMRGGSSGGPWVQNFGVVSSGTEGGTNPAENRILGVTSYGYVDTTPLRQGAAILDVRFTTLLNQLCAHRSGNC